MTRHDSVPNEAIFAINFIDYALLLYLCMQCCFPARYLCNEGQKPPCKIACDIPREWSMSSLSLCNQLAIASFLHFLSWEILCNAILFSQCRLIALGCLGVWGFFFFCRWNFSSWIFVVGNLYMYIHFSFPPFSRKKVWCFPSSIRPTWLFFGCYLELPIRISHFWVFYRDVEEWLLWLIRVKILMFQ